MVELGDAVVATADESEDLAGMGIEGDERDLGIGDVSVTLFVHFADEVVDTLHAGIDCFGRGTLEFWIERGVDAEAGVGGVGVADALDDLVVDEIDEVGSFAGFDVGLGEVEWLGLGAGGFGLGDGTGFDHGGENGVAALHCALGVAVGVEAVGGLDGSCEEGTLGGV